MRPMCFATQVVTLVCRIPCRSSVKSAFISSGSCRNFSAVNYVDGIPFSLVHSFYLATYKSNEHKFFNHCNKRYFCASSKKPHGEQEQDKDVPQYKQLARNENEECEEKHGKTEQTNISRKNGSSGKKPDLPDECSSSTTEALDIWAKKRRYRKAQLRRRAVSIERRIHKCNKEKEYSITERQEIDVNEKLTKNDKDKDEKSIVKVVNRNISRRESIIRLLNQLQQIVRNQQDEGGHEDEGFMISIEHLNPTVKGIIGFDGLPGHNFYFVPGSVELNNENDTNNSGNNQDWLGFGIHNNTENSSISSTNDEQHDYSKISNQRRQQQSSIQSNRILVQHNRFRNYRKSLNDGNEGSDGGTNSIGDDTSSGDVSQNSSSGVPSIIRGVPLLPHLYALGLYRKPAFPGFYQILQLQDESVFDFLVNMKKHEGHDYIGGFLTQTEPQEIESADVSPAPLATFRKDAGRVENPDDLYRTGTVMHIINFSIHAHVTGGQLIVMPYKRIKIKRISEVQKEESPLFNVDVEYVHDEILRYDVNDTQKALHLEIIATMKELLKTSYFYKEHFDQVVRFYNLDYPHKLADLIAGISFAKRDELQAVIDEDNIEKRLNLVLEIAKKDLEFAKLQVKVKNQVEEKVTKEQRKYMLMEQLKFIKRELGLEKDDKQTVAQGFQEAMEKNDKFLSEEVKKVMKSEIQRFLSLDPSSSEANISRTYLEWLTALPWGKYTTDNDDIMKAEQILNEDHYGLQDVKERVLEFIAVNILNGDQKGKIMCLVGPPGVGKTSVGQSISRALCREFYRFSLGGLYDVAELRGHRRTYVGAMPGKLIQALKQTKCFNPVILLDEIDKLGRDFRGDPSSALLEILDPNQNNTFRDYYMDVPVDLSKVLFICTANSTDSISGPLLDRMEIIRIAGYVFEEKLCIAEQYLIPQAEKTCGLRKEDLIIKKDALTKMVKDYAREAGVRNLTKFIEKIYRKTALLIVRKSTDVVKEVCEDNLQKLIGQPVFTCEKLFDKTPPGVVMGLAWTQMGGATLYVEAAGRVIIDADAFDSQNTENNLNNNVNDVKNDRKIRKRGMGSFKVTGQLGSVMNESSQIALSFSKNFIRNLQPQNFFLEEAEIHLHVPEGATSKDGPSAGITMACALISIALNRPVNNNLAMTGELTLTGKVLKIGGVKEKVIAAKRESVHNLIFPRSNSKDFEELADYIKEGLTIHFVDNFEDVFAIAFADSATP